MLLLWACTASEVDSDPRSETGDAAVVDSGLETGGAGDSSADDTSSDTGDSGDSGDTGEPYVPCAEATFTDLKGEVEDLSELFTSGENVVLTEEGTLAFCEGTWFVKLSVEADVTVVGLGLTPDATVLSGGEQSSEVTVTGASVVVENVTLDRGAALGSWNNERGGGGVRCVESGEVTLRDVVLSNHTAYDGAALYAGAGCHVDGESVTMSGNVSEDDAGAARFDYATADLRDVYVVGNSARDAGGFLLHESSVVIDGGVFSDNVSTDSQGGGVLHYFGTLSISRTVFDGNDVDAQGGGVSLFGDTTLEDVSFVDNTATYGGGIYHYGGYGTLTCTGCTFDGNTPDAVQSDVSGSFEVPGDGGFVCDEGGCRGSDR